MPGLYAKGDYDLAGFAVGAAERGTLLPRLDTIKVGDTLLGLASSGVHSNGYSLVRRIVELSKLSWADEAPFAKGKSLGDALLEPTRIYVKSLLAALRAPSGEGIKALAHITGGGFIDNIPRVLPKGFGVDIDLAKIAPPPVFGWLARTGGVAEHEMLRTFNCGIGMVIVVEPEKAAEVAASLHAEGETVSEIGKIIAADAEPLVQPRGKLAL